MKNNDELLNALKVFIECWEDSKEEDADEAALKELNAEVREIMELQGFTHWQTGGGCTAWGKHIFGGNNDASPYVMVTFSESSGAYFSELADAHAHTNSILVCFYDANGDWLGSDMPIYYSWEEFKYNFKGGF